MKKRKKISKAEIDRRTRQSKRDYQIRNIDKILKDNAKRNRELFDSNLND